MASIAIGLGARRSATAQPEIGRFANCAARAAQDFQIAGNSQRSVALWANDDGAVARLQWGHVAIARLACRGKSCLLVRAVAERFVALNRYRGRLTLNVVTCDQLVTILAQCLQLLDTMRPVVECRRGVWIRRADLKMGDREW